MQYSRNANRLTAIVVTHNRLSQLVDTVERLLESTTQDLTNILIFDNASTDGTGAWLDNLADPRLTILHSPSNIGGAGGFETAMRHAIKHLDPDWLLLMDDDGRPYRDTISAFHKSEHDGCDAIAGAVYTPNAKICDINRPSRNPFWHGQAFLKTLLGGGREGFHLTAADYAKDQPQKIDGASFVGLFVSRRAVEKVGYPKGNLFIYGEDALYTLSVSAAGGQVIFDPALRFEHDHQSREEGEARFRPLWKGYYHYRNLLIVYRLAAGLWFWPALCIILPRWLSHMQSHSGERRIFLRLMYHAVRDGLAQRVSRPHETIVAWSKHKLAIEQFSVVAPQKQEPQKQEE